jgi:hypothetical protein
VPNETLIDAVLDWPRQAPQFARDGTLRDIYVANATLEDWKVVAPMLERTYGARVQRRGAAMPMPMPTDLESMFRGTLDGSDAYDVRLTVGGVVVACHVFSPTQIEFSFEPHDVTETSLRCLLSFMLDIGEATGKSVAMTLESSAVLALFNYDASCHQLRWIPG